MINQEKDGLLPCPFCGSAALLQEQEPHRSVFSFMPSYPGSATIECTNEECGCGLIADTRDQVIERWDRRHHVPAKNMTSNVTGGTLCAHAGAGDDSGMFYIVDFDHSLQVGELMFHSRYILDCPRDLRKASLYTAKEAHSICITNCDAVAMPTWFMPVLKAQFHMNPPALVFVLIDNFCLSSEQELRAYIEALTTEMLPC